MTRHTNLAAVLVVALLVLLLVPPPAGSAATESEGYLPLPDGTRLRYTLVLPDGDGPFPVVLQYSGYNNGNNINDGTFGNMIDRVVDAGIAAIGVNLRGSGCSEGTFEPFGDDWARDGVDVVEWIADQDWSDGNVAMAGVSYPAITAMATAIEQPPSLKAVISDVPVIDLYRDVAYPGGMFNQSFASVWTFVQKYGTLFALQETAEGDLECPSAIPTQNNPGDLTGVQAASNPHIDSFARYQEFMLPEDLARVEVPTLVYTAWQDEQLGSRAMHAYEHLDPELRWVVGSNGDHIGFSGAVWHQDLMLSFLDHFLRGGTTDSFAVPRVQIARDVRKGDASFDELDTYDTYPVPTSTTTLHLHPDASLRTTTPAEPGTRTFTAPLPAPSVPVGIDVGAGFNPEVYNEAYKVPVTPGGALDFTTPALAEDLQVHGPLSLDVAISSTHTDADLQVSLTEVRPDGQELYVQRGWLRASRRVLDEVRTTATRPVPTFREGDVTPLVSGEPTPVRVEVWPVDHVFRAGSSLRITVESPVGFTGFRQLQFDPTPAQHTVHLGPDVVGQLVFGRIASPSVATDLPACDTLLNMPCRPDPFGVPDGTLTLAAPDDTMPTDPAPPSTPTAAPAPTSPGDTAPASTPMPSTGGGLALLGALAVMAAVRRRS